MPFDHLVVVMMENHSFDNLFGDLGRSRTDVDALSFDASGVATNSNPTAPAGEVSSFPFENTAQTTNVNQSWAASHEQIDGGAMDGFVRSSKGAHEPMGYYTPAVLPFAYSLAAEFTIGDRWFCSLPGPTYPNRRFLLAGTAFGGTVTSLDSLLDSPPPHGTIFDLLSAHNINWCNYFTDMPMTAVIPSIILKHPEHYAPLDKFFHDCQTGTLPAVSFIDPRIGVVSDIGAPLKSLPTVVQDTLRVLGANFEDTQPAETEEDPQDMYWGEAWAAKRSRPCSTQRTGSAPCSSTSTTSTAATTTTFRHRQRSHPTQSRQRSWRPTRRWVRHIRSEGPGGGGVSVLSGWRGHERNSRPHVGVGNDRREVEPARSHQPRR